MTFFENHDEDEDENGLGLPGSKASTSSRLKNVRLKVVIKNR